MEVNIELAPIKNKKKVEILNFNDKNGHNLFKKLTSETNEFTKCFDGKEPLLKQCNKWIQTVMSYCKRSFKTIRIRSNKIKPSKADKLINKRNKLYKHGNVEKVKSLDQQISTILANEGRDKAQMFKQYCDSSKTNNISEMWKLKKKLFPLKSQPYHQQSLTIKEESFQSKLS